MLELILNPLSIFMKIFRTVVHHLTPEIVYLRGYIRQFSNAYKMLNPQDINMKLTPHIHMV